MKPDLPSLDGHQGPPSPSARSIDGPWLAVVGMHRSGTSAVTGAIAALGLAEPAAADLMKEGPGNTNHHESLSMTAVGDRLLQALGGSWCGPPVLGEGWEQSAAARGMREDALAAIATAYPDPGPRVWKDPRSALLLPFWQGFIAEPLPAVFIWRAPLAVARSLQRRDGFTISHGLALWHHYNCASLAALSGRQVLLLRYEDLVLRPTCAIADIAEWLDQLGVAPANAARDLEAAAASVSHQLRHEVGEGALPSSQSQLADLLESLRGRHESFTPGPLPEGQGWVCDYLTERRAHEKDLSAYEQSMAHLHAERAELHRISAESVQRARVIDRLESDIAGRREEIERLSEELGRRSAEHARVVAELDRRSAAMEAIYGSRSWRVSAPLRAAGSLARSRLLRSGTHQSSVPEP